MLRVVQPSWLSIRARAHLYSEISMTAERNGHQRAPHQLPPGRHGLSRSYVAANQRERMLDAVADIVSFKGYVAMSVEEIVIGAGVSRRTFYDNFKDKEAAFLAAYDAVGTELLGRIRDSAGGSATFAEGVVACLRVFLEFTACNPRYADMCIVEVLAAGPAAIERRNTVMQALGGLFHRGAQTVPDGIRPPRLTAETVIGGIYEVVYSRVLRGETSELPALLSDLAYSMMLPYLGHEAAEHESRRLAAKVPT
jgi:AcrR family transcriptional regulator